MAFLLRVICEADGREEECARARSQNAECQMALTEEFNGKEKVESHPDTVATENSLQSRADKICAAMKG